MQLPGPDYTRGMSSLGREGAGASVSLEAAASSKMSDAGNILKDSSAKAAIAKDVTEFAAEIYGWNKAYQESKAAFALSEYHRKVAETETEISNARAYKASDIPPEVQVERFQKAEDGTEVERQIPQWEAAPGLFDYRERKLAEEALAQVPQGQAKVQLQMKIAERRTAGAMRIKEQSYKGRLEVMQDNVIQAATNFANQSNYPAAINTIGQAVNNGTLTVDQARKMQRDILQAADETKAMKTILVVNDPTQLRKVEAELLASTEPGADNPYPYLSPEKRVAIAARADTKAIELEKAGIAQQKKDNTAAINAVLLQADLDKRNGKLLTLEEYNNKVKVLQMSPDQAAHLYRNVINAAEPKTMPNGKALVDRLRQEREGFGSDTGGTAEAFVDGARAELDKAVRDGILSSEDRQSALTELNAFVKGIYSTEEHKDAEKMIKTQIEEPRSTRSKPWVEAIRAQFSRDLNIAASKNPKLDRMKWVQDNTPKYAAMVKDNTRRTLKRYGVDAYIVETKEGDIDRQATINRLTEEKKKPGSRITDDDFKEAIDTLSSEER